MTHGYEPTPARSKASTRRIFLLGTLVLALLPLMAGCTSGDPTNPNLLAPKVVVDVLPDGSVSVFVHSAFGERRYDTIDVLIDNSTSITRESVFSLEEIVDRPQFFLDVKATSGESSFRLRASFDLDTTKDERIEVASFEDGKWSEAREYGLPFERILSRLENES